MGNQKTSYPQQTQAFLKRKKKQKKKNVLKYGKLKEFPTFQHDKQTTICFIFTNRDNFFQDDTLYQVFHFAFWNTLTEILCCTGFC
jgi:hypothetical protein